MTGGSRLLHKLLLCSDTHETAPRVRKTADALCWLHAGDFYLNKDMASADDDTDDQYADTIGALEGGEAYQWFKTCSLPIYTIRGNHDGHDAWGFFRTAHDISGGAVHIAPQLLLAGVGWHGRNYNDLPSESNFYHPCSMVAKAVRQQRKNGDLLVLISHYPAYAPPAHSDSPGPFARLRALVEEIQPSVIVQGHVHEWAGTYYEAPLGERRLLVVNPGPIGGILTVDPTTLSTVFDG